MRMGKATPTSTSLIPELVSGIQFKKGPYYADEGDFSTVGAAHYRVLRQAAHSTGLALVTLGSYDYYARRWSPARQRLETVIC